MSRAPGFGGPTRREALGALAAIGVAPWRAVASAPQAPARDWPPVSADARRAWSAEALRRAQQHAGAIGSAAVLVVEDGGVVAAWGDVSGRRVAYSIRKSLLSALIGVEVGRGVIRTDATLVELGVDDLTPLTDAEKQATVGDLMRSRSGVYLPVAFESPRMRATRPARGQHPPGAHFFYNNWDFNVLGAIYEQATGRRIGDAFAREIAAPIGMQDFRPEDVYWLNGPESRFGAFHFTISSRDLARVGLLYLRQGRWDGRPVIPAEWVRLSTISRGMVPYAGRDTGGYEQLWWVAHEGVHLPGLSLPGAYSARGAGGHHVLVIPDRRLVIVHRGDNEPASHAFADVAAAGVKPGVSEADFARLVGLILAARAGA